MTSWRGLSNSGAGATINAHSFIATTAMGGYRAQRTRSIEGQQTRMNRKRPAHALACLILGAALIASGAEARTKKADIEKGVKEAAAAAAALPTFSAVVDTDVAHDPDNVLLLDLSNGQRVAIRLMPQWAPAHVERIKTLTRQGFYNGIIFHRVIDGFMAQTGDPTGTGEGGSTLPNLKAEFNALPHVRGTVSMARTNEADTANSQFFIVFYPHFALDRKYTNFGRVIAGMEAADAIARGEPPANPTRIAQASLASEHKAPPASISPRILVAPTVAELNNSKSN